MLFSLRIDVNLPRDLDPLVRTDLEAREREMVHGLQRRGVWRHLWRIVGRRSNLSIVEADSHEDLQQILESLPLYPFVSIEVTPLSRHPAALDGAN